MSTIQTIAVAGATGNVGKEVVNAIVSAGLQAVILAREGTAAAQLSGPGISVKIVDYSSKQTLVDALKGSQGIVSLLSGPAWALQDILADAAVEAGVIRFIPSEFGCSTHHPEAESLPVFAPKIATQKHLEKLVSTNEGFSYTLLFTGPFLDFILKFGLSGDFKARKIELVDGGEKAFSTTPIPETAKAIVGVFKNLEATKNKAVKTESARLTQLQLVRLAEKLTGEKFETSNTNSDELLQAGYAELKKGSSPHVWAILMIKNAIFNGKGASLWDGNDNAVVGLKPWTEAEVEAELKRYL